MSIPSYSIVTPARNERDNLRRLATCVLEQRARPACWMIVDDGSDDGMGEDALELSRVHDWILVRSTGKAATNWRRGAVKGAICWHSGGACGRFPAPWTSSSRSTPTPPLRLTISSG